MLLFSAAQLCGLQDCVCTIDKNPAKIHKKKILSSEDRITDRTDSLLGGLVLAKAKAKSAVTLTLD